MTRQLHAMTGSCIQARAWAWEGLDHRQRRAGRLGGPWPPRARAPQLAPPIEKIVFLGWVRYMFTEGGRLLWIWVA